MQKRLIPKFANESEEADWWYQNRAQTAKDLVAASQQGRNGEGSLGRHARKLRELALKEMTTQPEVVVAKR